MIRPGSIDHATCGVFSDMPSSSLVPASILLLATVSTSWSAAQSPDRPGSTDWKTEEAAFLADPIQLTFNDRFVKAGESYFSPDGEKVIFQAVGADHRDAARRLLCDVRGGHRSR